MTASKYATPRAFCLCGMLLGLKKDRTFRKHQSSKPKQTDRNGYCVGSDKKPQAFKIKLSSFYGVYAGGRFELPKGEKN